MVESILEVEMVVHWNLNNYVTVKLTDAGREVLRTYVSEWRRQITTCDPPYSGDEIELRLQMWEFIGVFGSNHRHWMSGGISLVSMDVAIEVGQ